MADSLVRVERLLPSVAYLLTALVSSVRVKGWVPVEHPAVNRPIFVDVHNVRRGLFSMWPRYSTP